MEALLALVCAVVLMTVIPGWAAPPQSKKPRAGPSLKKPEESKPLRPPLKRHRMRPRQKAVTTFEPERPGKGELFDECDEVRHAELPAGFRACVVATGLQQPRQLVVSNETDDAIVLVDRVGCSFLLPDQCDAMCGQSGNDSIITMKDLNRNGLIDKNERYVLWEGDELRLSHGLAVHRGYLFASNATHVMRWPYTPGQTSPLNESQRVVVMTGMNIGGCGAAALGHLTRTLIVDDQDRLYVTIGSFRDSWPGDEDSSRARIQRFENVTDPLVLHTYKTQNWTDGEVFADGTRNTVGLAFDPKGRLWGVDTNDDFITHEELGGDDVREDNPSEELNLFTEERAGRSFGYPRCWTEGRLGPKHARGRGSQWSVPGRNDTYIKGQGRSNDTTRFLNDTWCQNISNNQPPELPLQAHASHIGIAFLGGKGSSDRWRERCEETGESANGGFPCEYGGDAFLAAHGTYQAEDCPPCDSRSQLAGYQVSRVLMDEDGMPTGEVLKLLAEETGSNDWDVRPVSTAFDSEGRMFVSDDGTGQILMVYYRAALAETAITESPSPLPLVAGFTPAQPPKCDPARAAEAPSGRSPLAMHKHISQCASSCLERGSSQRSTAGFDGDGGGIADLSMASAAIDKSCEGFSVDVNGTCAVHPDEAMHKAQGSPPCTKLTYRRAAPPEGYFEKGVGSCRAFSAYPAPLKRGKKFSMSYSRLVPAGPNAKTIDFANCVNACDDYGGKSKWCVGLDYDYANRSSYPCHLYVAATKGKLVYAPVDHRLTQRAYQRPDRWCLGRDVPREILEEAEAAMKKGTASGGRVVGGGLLWVVVLAIHTLFHRHPP
ncbi:unnamed protein product [Vitrella brassicaformis CCMP3155]|uniref:Pyrroloquinoline quinone-dependent pyranose dehydrogenase beta-propeller domain-containing protein n=1 Tax=Vitrella brassicaformis (strain CCMP3155) TaxID=1169540 RepID=A0A0G4GBI8_VITBC|nr:unnamed protein product [Vitrella brassicaformis CCMP3155]|eukprot:CEM26351.1 unnamed protein product [Vitrella brassicaformis CCMP3155]